jgi:hypothetical protein
MPKAPAADQQWQPLSLLNGQFQANLQALRTLRGGLAEQLERLAPLPRVLLTGHGGVRLAVRDGGSLQLLPNPVPPSAAQQIAAKLCPTGQCTGPLVVAGLDQGWLWKTLYDMPASTPALPGHRPPLYFLTGDLERLWTAMHLHDWRTMLADPRVCLLAGPDAFEQLRSMLVADDRMPWPRTAVTIEPKIWPAGESIDTLFRHVQQQASQRLATQRRLADAAYTWATDQAVADRLRAAGPLRVLGITSRYTTFLQYSMRDWLDAFRRLGHETHMLIEDADHQAINKLIYTQAVAEFRPDLIVLIDHYRAEMPSIPTQVPCVMWVQDQLPNICNPQAGAAQGPRDYCLGFGRLMHVRRHGYPAERYMPATVSVNDERFAPSPLTGQEQERFGCDVSFVSHASVPADAIVTEQVSQLSPEGRRLVCDAFDRLRAIYEQGQAVTQPIAIRRLIEQSLLATRTSVDAEGIATLMDLFTQRINNALFRHQTLHWLAAMDVDLHIHGRGWEQHPTLKRFARGVADNNAHLSAIYRASRINLQATPHGAVHQRLLDGLSAGGFFLIRYCPGDEIEAIYRPLHEWCRAQGITTDQEIFEQATPQVQTWLDRAEELLGVRFGEHDYSLSDALELSADGDYIRSAAAIWPEYQRVSFRSADELRRLVSGYLANESERRRVAQAMRRPVIDRFSYVATTQRLLDFVAIDLQRQARSPLEVAA